MVHRFGVTSNIPAYLPVALGAAESTLKKSRLIFPSFPTTAFASPRAHPQSLNADALPCGRTAAVSEVIDKNTARTMMILLRASPTMEQARPQNNSTLRSAEKPEPPATSPTPGSSAQPFRHLRRVVGYDSRQSLAKRKPAPRLPSHLDDLHESSHRRKGY